MNDDVEHPPEEEPPLFDFDLEPPLEPRVAGRFQDLAPRLGTAAFLFVIGGAAVWIGGLWFVVLISLCVGTMLWELATMLRCGPKRARLMAGVGGVALFLANVVPVGFGLPLLMPRALSESFPNKVSLSLSLSLSLCLRRQPCLDS